MKYRTFSIYWRNLTAMAVVAAPFLASVLICYQDWSSKLRPICKIMHLMTTILAWVGAILGYQWDVEQVITTFVKVHGNLDLLWQYITTATM